MSVVEDLPKKNTLDQSSLSFCTDLVREEHARVKREGGSSRACD